MRKARLRGEARVWERSRQNQTWGQAREFKALGSRDLPMSRQAMHSSIMGHGYGIKPVISAGGRTKGLPQSLKESCARP